ncbi:MAG: 30S ribosomal protein S9 [Puniceicoccales bacterium]|jgi:small subunit ribosomal protein S9|nr:30S ribosomal protein S9 [Puniceicoccales bacterium]
MGQKEKECVEFCGTGRRKCAVARVKIREGSGKIDINGKSIIEFCSLDDAERKILAPLIITGKVDKIDAKIKTSGGGIIGQVGAISLGLSRSLEKMDPALRLSLKKAGLLTRDGRVRERKKPGQPGARKHYQFSKR